MKLLLIKIGKAWHTLRREGLFHGGKRVFVAASALFRRVQPGDILFISGGVGDSARYRCEHVAEELSLQGYRTSVTVQDNPFLLSYTEQFSVFVFHRVLYTGQAKSLFIQLKKLQKEIIFETDDLVYDPQYLVHMDYFQHMNTLEKKLYEHGVGGEMLADPYVQVATTTTSFLAEKLRARGKQVFVVPNKLSGEDMKKVDTTLENQSKKDTQSEKVVVSYFSGTASHNKDFATITEPLLFILERYPHTELALYGPLDLDERFSLFGTRVKKLPFAGREKHFENISQTDINVAPLEIDNPFCESKSELKFFEAGAFGVPTIATATQTFREAIENGVDGFVAATPAEWKDCLEQLVKSATLRKTMGEQARKKVLSQYVTTNTKNSLYYQYLSRKIAKKEDKTFSN
jgi:glycosyltransferase involved in cell wall biosynthesis